MMRKLLITLAMLAFAAPAFAYLNFNVLVGSKALGSSDWKPVEQQSLRGFHFDGTPASWPLAITADLFDSKAEKTTSSNGIISSTQRIRLTGETSEYDLGVRGYLGDEERAAIFLGGGVGLVTATAHFRTPSGRKFTDTDTGQGLWADTGIMGRFFGNVNLGVDLRWSSAKMKIFGSQTNAGGTSTIFFVGYGF